MGLFRIQINVLIRESVDGMSSVDAYHRRGASVRREMRGKTLSSCGLRRKPGYFSSLLWQAISKSWLVQIIPSGLGAI
jgi:hypothetical protein